MQNKVRHSYAPFGSVSSKKPKKKKNQPLSPGPGSYDVSLPVVAPIIQTIRKQNNNIIVKLGHLGTSAFLANGNRFQEKKPNVLGPGQYYRSSSEDNHKRSSKNIRRYAALRLKQLIHSPIQRQPSISQIKRIDFDDEIEMPNKINERKNKIKEQQIRGCAWSRMTEQRNKSGLGSIPDSLGPGSYNLQSLPKIYQRQPSSAFVSKGVRSFFDQIRFGTNHDQKARSREQKHYKSDEVGPGSYQIEPKKRKSIQQYQFFGSTEQRF